MYCSCRLILLSQEYCLLYFQTIFKVHVVSHFCHSAKANSRNGLQSIVQRKSLATSLLSHFHLFLQFVNLQSFT